MRHAGHCTLRWIGGGVQERGFGFGFGFVSHFEVDRESIQELIEPALATEFALIFLRVVSVDQIRVPVVRIMLCACVCLGRGIGVGVREALYVPILAMHSDTRDATSQARRA